MRSAVTAAVGPIPDDAPLMDAGLDSVAALDLRAALATALGAGDGAAALPPSLAFDHPTVDALTAFLVDWVAGRAKSVGMTVRAEEGVPVWAGAPAAFSSSFSASSLSVAAIVDTALTTALGTLPDPHAPLTDAGLDSVGAVDVRASLARAVFGEGSGADALPVSFVFDHPSRAALTAALQALVDARQGRAAAASPPSLPRALSVVVPPAAAATSIAAVSARLPGAHRGGSAWPLLSTGADTAAPVPPARWDADAFYEAPGAASFSSLPPSAVRAYARCAHWCDAVDAFDAASFSLPPTDAAATDPQARLLLEGCAVALMSGGGLDAGARGRTGVFTGSMYQEFTQLHHELGLRLTPAAATGAGISYLCGRASYTFGLRGPCVGVDTACSSSLVATHLASRSLAAGDALAALAAGVNAMTLPITTATICGLGALAPDGRCKTLDASADGYGRGEAFIVALLRTAVDANNTSSTMPSLGLIAASTVGQDGRSSSLTAPSGPAQSALVAEAARAAAVNPHTDPLALALHGTATPLGDPLELGALAAVFGGASKGYGGGGVPTPPPPLTLAAPKASVGHTEGAAGVVGLLAALLTLEQSGALPNPHARTLNPHVGAALTEWGVQRGAACAAVVARARAPAHGLALGGASSFGMSGTNAHALVRPPVSGAAPRPTDTVLPWRRDRVWPGPRPPPFIISASIDPHRGGVEYAVRLTGPSLAWLLDHRVGGTPLLPGAAVVEAATAAAATLVGDGWCACGTVAHSDRPHLCGAPGAGWRWAWSCQLPPAGGRGRRRGLGGRERGWHAGNARRGARGACGARRAADHAPRPRHQLPASAHTCAFQALPHPCRHRGSRCPPVRPRLGVRPGRARRDPPPRPFPLPRRHARPRAHRSGVCPPAAIG